MKHPAISVVIPNYNNALYLPDCLESILTQTFTDFECIVVDDGSSDDSWDILENFAKKDARIKIFRQKEHKGIPSTRNLLLSLSQGRYIAMMDSDDICLPNRLAVQYEFLESHPNIGLVGSNVYKIDEQKNILFECKKPETHKQICNTLFYKNPFFQNTIMIRRSLYTQIGRYNESFSISEDLEYWSRIIKYTETYNIQKCLVSYRIHSHSATHTSAKEILKHTIIVQQSLAKQQSGYFMKHPFHLFVYILCRIGSHNNYIAQYILHPPGWIYTTLSYFRK